MNAYEIAEIEKTMKADYRLPLSYAAWSDIEREARQARAEAAYQAMSAFFGSVLAKLAGVVRQVRGIAAECTGARLRHDH
ncbi:MAG TPA: hypothetical protein VF876_16185 [Burkholderiales bacterium]